jgi:hypothetical protein
MKGSWRALVNDDESEPKYACPNRNILNTRDPRRLEIHNWDFNLIRIKFRIQSRLLMDNPEFYY